MGFNYAREKRRFEKEWEQLHEEYSALGMDEAAIDRIKEFDWRWFCSRRVYAHHNQHLPDEGDFPEDRGLLIRRYRKLVTEFDELKFSGRYAWLHEIEDEELYRRLDTLPGKDIELLTLIIEEGYRQADVARMWECSRNSVSKRWNKIKKILTGG